MELANQPPDCVGQVFARGESLQCNVDDNRELSLRGSQKVRVIIPGRRDELTADRLRCDQALAIKGKEGLSHGDLIGEQSFKILSKLFNILIEVKCQSWRSAALHVLTLENISEPERYSIGSGGVGALSVDVESV
jgi:hypothetical protein